MTTFHIITIFPEAIRFYFESSILKRAQKKGLIKIKFYNPRDWAKDKHKTIDGRPFGGGPGMVFKVDVIVRTVLSVLNKIKNRTKIVLLSPAGKQFEQKTARDFAKKYRHIILICGHYEGIDARLGPALRVTRHALQELSVGPYILTGGELAAGIVVDAMSRQIPGVLGKEESLEEKRGLGIPVFTRPEVFEFKSKKYRVPKVLLSGNHKKIEEWRNKNKGPLA